ncbi:folylpolyglutamate synthase [Aspergillus sergii]|uniref:tetrahydrofolate synthase n=1 Tax=Aspergillus sergii TaxID=1034303 RepID=A0A5N6XAP3_9EURO|nr:folylpolyglutamate synthase [Aspergillus sergii]
MQNMRKYQTGLTLPNVVSVVSLTADNALKLLETRKRKGRPKAPAVPPARQNTTSPSDSHAVRGTLSLVGVKEWLKMLGYTDSDVNALNIIQITGTKGKGSTCAFTRSFLHTHGLRTGSPKWVGLYTSPHLQCIRESIQIDEQLITEDLFTKYLFEVWERLMFPDLEEDIAGIGQPLNRQLLALLAFHTFIREDVDAAIFETHHGGEYDSTNVIENPVVTGITSLGIDHIVQLGPTIENIAWHKAGIFKTGAPAFSVPQDTGPAGVLRNYATEKMVPLTFVSTNSYLPANKRVLRVPVQRLNCSLALELSKGFLHLKALGHEMEPEDISVALENFSWIGRFEVIEIGTSQWFLDGAHNTLSLEQAAIWFSNNTKSSGAKRSRVLIFSHLFADRDGGALVQCLAHTLAEYDARPDDVIFTTYKETDDMATTIHKTLNGPDTAFPDLCSIYSVLWKELDPQAIVSTELTIEAAIRRTNQINVEKGGVQVLLTGSLHLVGRALNFLRP